jgi:sortase A
MEMSGSRGLEPVDLQLARAHRRERLRAALAHEGPDGADAIGSAGAAGGAPRAARVDDWSRRVRALLGARRLAAAFGAVLAALGLGHAGWVEAKAALAQVLLVRAWEHTRSTGEPARPWPWADTVPVARLRMPRLEIDQIVLSGAGGRSLAFGPSMSGAGALPGEPGTVVVSAHRDTHFRFLRELSIGDRIWLETSSAHHAYEITAIRVVDSRREGIAVDGDEALLNLVTCYPFDAINPRGPLRYVVTARLAASARPAV